MANFEIKKASSGQKLAEALKKCGIASSVTEANKIAGDIRNTEKKVQSFFDQRKKEIHEEFIKSVHPNRFDSSNPKDRTGQTMIRQAAISQSQSSSKPQAKQTTDFKNEAVKGMIERAKNPSPLNIQVEFETPKQGVDEKKPLVQETPATISEIKKTEPAPVVVYESNFSHHEDVTPNNLISEQDYISKFIKNEKEEIPAEEKEAIAAVHTPEVIQKAATIEKKLEVKIEESAPLHKPEVKVDLGNYFGAKKQESPKQEEHKPVEPQAQSAPKPQAPAVDIHNFFNFAKKGKV